MNNQQIKENWEKNKHKPKKERINQKLRELSKEWKKLLAKPNNQTQKETKVSDYWLLNNIPKPKIELTRTEITASFLFLFSVVLFALWCGIYPNLYGLVGCVGSTLAFLSSVILTVIHRTFN